MEKGNSHSQLGDDKRLRTTGIVFAVLLGISLVGELVSKMHSSKGWTRISEIKGEEIKSIGALSQTQDGAIWIGTKSRAYRFDGTSWKEYNTDDSFSGDDIQAIAESPDGELWIGTDCGEYRYNGIDWTSFPVADSFPCDDFKSINVSTG